MQQAQNPLTTARIAGRTARVQGKPFNATQYGVGTLESQAFVAGWRAADYDIKDGIPVSLDAALMARV